MQTSFSQFQQDVLEVGPKFAVNCAVQAGVPSGTLAVWMGRMVLDDHAARKSLTAAGGVVLGLVQA